MNRNLAGTIWGEGERIPSEIAEGVWRFMERKEIDDADDDDEVLPHMTHAPWYDMTYGPEFGIKKKFK